MPRGGVDGGAQPLGSLDTALSHAARLLQTDPNLASEQAGEILKAVPKHPLARLILGASCRLRGLTQSALGILEPLAAEQPQSAPVHMELGVALAETGRGAQALAALRRAVQLKPDSPDAWRLLADQLDAAGEAGAADLARARYLKAASRDPQLIEAATALVANELPAADLLLRSHLNLHPKDIAALRMLAEVCARLRRYSEAQRLLERCLELAPSFDAARHNYAVVLNRQSLAAAALAQVTQLLAKEPRNPSYRNLQAAILANLGDYGESIAVYRAILEDHPRQPKIWMSYGHSLKTARRHAESIAAYRRAIELQPSLGEAYWSLANLKTFRFSVADVRAMRTWLSRPDLSDDDRLHFEFSLGKALEDEESYSESFEHYVSGNGIRRRLHPYDAAENTEYVRRSQATFTREFFADRAGAGHLQRDPIFILGLPRAGSTLLEQMLASHSLVEGTMELPNIARLARDIARQGGAQDHVQALAALSRTELRLLGERYMDDTRTLRKTGKPYFIDKMPNNCLYVGLIHLILPNATIIDARRHPLACCFSCFKQHFARGQNFTYDLEDLGRYYRDYVSLMDHIDGVLPGRVYRVYYERMVRDTESEVRLLLAHCGLPFEESCLRFYENERAVRTASSEQVRQPIFREGMDHFRHYQPWLGPLENVLGDALARYPESL